MQDSQASMTRMAREARGAAEVLALAPTEKKNAALLAMACRLEVNAAELVEANRRDVGEARKRGLSATLVARLHFGERRVLDRVGVLREIASLPDPVGEMEEVHREDGLVARRRRAPIGVVAMIYEARPHVTVNAGALCLKAGNAALLKGGSEALQCNRLLGELWAESLSEAGLPPGAVQVIATSDRAALQHLLSLDELVDLVIPRGGPALIEAVTGITRIPVVKHSHGVCHVYVDAAADLEKACAIVVDSKTYAPAVCNAAEALLVHEEMAPSFLPKVATLLERAGVRLRGCERTRALVPGAEVADDDDWGKEYLDLVYAVRVVDDLEGAVEHISRYGSAHTDVIVSEDSEAIREFVSRVDSGVVLVNASTMFNDASRLGMGAEVGISSDKVHARGPMGLRELTCQRWVIEGAGHVFSAGGEEGRARS